MAAPTINVVVSRTTGNIPLGVMFDATGTTGVTDPIHNLIYRWNFGDSDNSAWIYGSNVGQCKNSAFGPVAAHVYESVGSFTWTLQVINSAGEVSQTTGVVTTSDWANDANTICAGNVLPIAGQNGVPSNATCVASNNLAALIGTYMASGSSKRLLLKRGDTFNVASTPVVSSTGPSYIGAFGTGADPIVEITGDCPAISINASDCRVSGLYIDGNAGTSSRGVQIAAAAGTITQLTVINNTITDVQHGVITRERTSNLEDQVFVVNNNIIDTNNFCVYAQTATRFAMLGNNLAAKTGASGVHTFRAGWLKTSVLSNNTMSKASSGCHNIKLHGPTYGVVTDFTEKVIISNNHLIGGNPGTIIDVEPQNDLIDERIRNVIIENNYVPSGAASDTPCRISGSKITARNNIINFTGGPVGTNFSTFYVLQRGAEPIPDEIWIYNNTVYNPVANPTFRILRMDDVPTNVVLRNNLAYSPNSTTVEVSFGTGGTGSSQSNNSTIAGVTDGIKVNPLFDGPLTTPIGFSISINSYASNGGTNIFPPNSYDFFQAKDKTNDVRIGASVPRAQALVRSVAS